MKQKIIQQGKKLSVQQMRKLKGAGLEAERCLRAGSTCGGECIDPFPKCCPGTYCTGTPGRGGIIGFCAYGDPCIDCAKA